MSHLQDGFGGYLALFVAGYLATELWRWLGLAVGAGLDLDGTPFQGVKAVATALVAGLVARMVVFPAGALASVPMAVRLGAFAGGIAIYFGLRRNLAAGVAGGAALLLAAQLLHG